MELTLTEQDADNWVYRGEGAANLVLSYNGSSFSYIGKVMRIRKSPRKESLLKGVRNSIALTPHERLIWKDVHELISSSDKEIAGQLYVQHVMKPLLGSKYVDAGNHILVTKEFLESVEKNVVSQRPAWRVDVSRVDTQCDFGLLMSDHSLFPDGTETCCQGSSPSISVEIKPKCGFLPQSEFISEGTAIKRRVTRFEMHQALKLQHGEVSQPSAYNPLDLFSGSKERIHKAIKDLFATPQNNFRLFLNGSLILGGLGGGAKTTDVCIAKVLEDELNSIIQADDGLCTENLLTLITEAVQKSGVLDQLLKVQKLDNVDIEGAIHAYYDITSQQCRVCRELSEEQAKRYASLHSASLDESLRIVKDYLIAATAKDCSLMICFRPRKAEDSGAAYNTIYLESTKQAFDFKVHFIDLDLKRMSKMDEYYELDKKIVSCYKQMSKMNRGRNEDANLQGPEVAE
ncbi:inositol-pentakisphosphate 2-kinase-like isoform X2 [Cicer arietinum]|uniref:Inositol-pentakisphosphate 2-kinase n=1 Tax=Cicer arietinum TaxID=3827 RepID=A0A1S2Y695_CICAR|nr:inositol-pentakisphosphate 2-kinase-like isoform X2 [Cicer arietinum]